MRGLKQERINNELLELKSHLLQMRGLKRQRQCVLSNLIESHLLQMRGLKQNVFQEKVVLLLSRIFYRCVD